MANPYEWSEDREPRDHDRDDQDARAAAERRAGQERSWRPEREPRGQGGEARYDDPGNFDRYEPDGRRREHRLAMEREADRIRAGLERGWRRVSEGMRHAFDERRPGAYNDDPRRAGGMFGGQDRRDSLFSHGDGFGAARMRAEGPHRGKGPKGYARSDASILEDVSDRLAEDGRLDASDIEVKVEAGEVTLNGQVASRADKRRAEDLAEQVSGVKHLQNNLRVRPPAEPAQGAAPSPAQAAARPQPQPAPAPTSAQITAQPPAGSRPS